MTLRPCLDCGAPSRGPRCPAHTRTHDQQRRPSPNQRGYTSEYRRNRALLLIADDRCWICGQPGADTADHVLPTSRGGTSDLSNLRPAHLSCNSGRGNRGAPPTGAG